MIRSRIRLMVLISSLSFLGCEEKIKPDIPSIDLSEAYKKREQVNLSSIATSIEYIPLETNDKSILDKIRDPMYNIVFVDSLIFIRDQSDNLLLFNTEGAFKAKVGSKGKGPGEYPRLQNIASLPNEHLLIAYSATLGNKVLAYDYNGNFTNEFKVDFWPMGLFNSKQDLYFVNTLGVRRSSNYYELTKVNANGKVLDRYLKKEQEEELSDELEFRLVGFSGNGYYLGEEFYYFENTAYEKGMVWKIEGENLIPIKEINIGGNIRPLEKQLPEYTSTLEGLIEYDYMDSFIETLGYIFADIYYEGDDQRHNHILYDKKNGISKSMKIDFSHENLNRKRYAITNDLDGGMPFWPDGFISDNKIYMLIEGHQLKEFLKVFPLEDKVIETKAADRLTGIAQKSELTDNPIIMIVNLKDF